MTSVGTREICTYHACLYCHHLGNYDSLYLNVMSLVEGIRAARATELHDLIRLVKAHHFKLVYTVGKFMFLDFTYSMSQCLEAV